MTGGGRPLRFLALVMIGWVGARGMMLWPRASPVAAMGRAVLPQALAREGDAVAVSPLPFTSWRYRTPLQTLRSPPLRPAATAAAQPAIMTREPVPGAAATVAVAERSPGIVPGLPTALPPPGARRSRLFGSAWLFVRQGSGLSPGVPGVQLGGSQAGVRVAYALREDRRLALAARLSAPLGPGMRELALGVEWQPTRLPVRVVVEQRIALNTGSGGPTLGLVGGAGPVPIGAEFDLEAYGQAGVIGRGDGEAFADGAVRAARPVATLGSVRIDLGASGWGAAQKGATRLDIGPSLSARIPLGGQSVRLSLDWRERVAGNARPGSGLVLSLGADF